MNFIYKISNDINDKVYIGKTGRTIEERFKEHQLASKKEYKNRPLYNAMNKYGIEHFFVEQIEECKNDKEACEREIYWINQFDSYHNGYNATLGGDGTAVLELNDEEIVEKYKELKSKRAVGRYFNIDEKTVRNILNKYDVDTYILDCKKIVMIKDNNIIHIFKNVKEANEFLGVDVNSHNLYKVLNHFRKTAYGYKWQYLEEIAA